MNQPSATKRPRTKLWQFSIANLLVAIALVAFTCGAFRQDVGLGIGALHLTIAAAIAFVRARAAVGHGEELWDALDIPHFVRQNETVYLCFTSFGVAFAALFFFHVGFWSAALLALSVVGCFQGLVIPFLLILVIVVPGAGMYLSVWWLKSTWPKSYFTRATSISSPL